MSVLRRILAEANSRHAPDPTAAAANVASASVSARVRAQQIQALDATALSGTANLPTVILAAFVIRSSVEAIWLYLWIAATAVVVLALIGTLYAPLAQRTGQPRPAPTLQRRLGVRVFFATAIGSVWGGGFLAFGPSLDQSQMLYLAVIILGCNAACISGLGPYLPAFFGYCVTSAFPLAFITFSRHEPLAHDLTLLVILFIAVVTVNVRAYNRQVLAAFRLRAENEALAANVVRANVATAEAKRSKWTTLAHLSHELRTPMNAIIGFSQMMSQQMFGPLGERYLAYSGHIHHSGQRMLDLIDSIQDVSRAEAGQIVLDESELAPAALVEECLQTLEPAAKHITVDRRFGPSPPRIVADYAKLRQALLNLLTNAVRYTRDGGRVSVGLAWADGGLEIAITDNGVGIAAADLEKCLEPFVRVGNPLIAGVEGVGLGLPLAKRLVEAHGGSLSLASEPGQGTTATIHLPSERCWAPDPSVGKLVNFG